MRQFYLFHPGTHGKRLLTTPKLKFHFPNFFKTVIFLQLFAIGHSYGTHVDTETAIKLFIWDNFISSTLTHSEKASDNLQIEIPLSNFFQNRYIFTTVCFWTFIWDPCTYRNCNKTQHMRQFYFFDHGTQ